MHTSDIDCIPFAGKLAPTQNYPPGKTFLLVVRANLPVKGIDKNTLEHA